MRDRVLPGLVAATWIGVVIGSCRGTPGRAAEPEALTEHAFVARVERSNPRIQALETGIGRAEAEVEAVRVRPNPSLSFTREETFASGEAYPEHLVVLGLPLDLSGRRGLGIESARAGVGAARADAAAARLEIVLEALAAYRVAAYQRLRADALRSGREALAGLVETVARRVRAGDASGYDGQRLALELAAHDDLITSAETDLAAARRRLAAIVGEPGASFEATAALELPRTPSPQDVLGPTALAGRADYQATTLRRAQAARSEAAAGRGWVPDLILTGGLKTSDLGSEVATGYVAGVSLTLPVFDHGQGERARAIASRRVAEAEARLLEREIPASIGAATEELELRVAQARKFAEVQLGQLEALLRGAEVSYREGERPVFELLDAYRTAREVRLRELDLRRDASLSELELWRALGRRP